MSAEAKESDAVQKVTQDVKDISLGNGSAPGAPAAAPAEPADGTPAKGDAVSLKVKVKSKPLDYS